MKNYKDWFYSWLFYGVFGIVVTELVRFFFIDDLISVLYRASDVKQAPLIFRLHIIATLLFFLLSSIISCLVGTCIKLIKLSMNKKENE